MKCTYINRYDLEAAIMGGSVLSIFITPLAWLLFFFEEKDGVSEISAWWALSVPLFVFGAGIVCGIIAIVWNMLEGTERLEQFAKWLSRKICSDGEES